MLVKLRSRKKTQKIFKGFSKKIFCEIYEFSLTMKFE